MRKLAIFLSVLMVLQFTCWAPLVSASNISFTPAGSGGEGTLSGDVAANRIGKLQLDHGVVSIKGSVVDVLVSGADLTQKKTVLSGVVYKSKVHGSGTHAKIEGGCFFTSGSGLSEIDDANAKESVDLIDGTVVDGHIVSLNQDECQVETKSGRRQLAMASISAIHSPRAKTFCIPVVSTTAVSSGTAFTGTCSHCSFSPTCSMATAHVSTHVAKAPKQSRSYSKGEGSKARKIITIAIAMCLIATAIAVPIAVATSGGHHHNNSANNLALFNFLRSQQSAPTPAPVVAAPAASSNDLRIDDIPNLSV